MNSYSQGNEDLAVNKWFGDFTGCLLSIGENSGTILSNALGFIENGWQALLVEPAKEAFEELQELHAANENVYCVNAAIGETNGEVVFYDSGSHLSENDRSLLSSVNYQETVKWRSTTEFTETKVQMITFDKLLQQSPYKKFQYITIDAESKDIEILRQMNLTELGCVCICVEWNSDPKNLAEIKRLCSWYGLNNEILRNAENVILTIGN